MGAIQYGCQLYTWQMNKEKYAGKLDHIVRVVKESGFQGIELETCMLGDYFEHPEQLQKLLDDTGIRLVSVCLVCDWRNPEETQEERRLADKTLEFIRCFDNVLLNICQMPGQDRENLEERQRNAISCINAVAKRAAEKGIPASFHPNSPAGSIFRTEQDYEVLYNGLDFSCVGFCPDSGHMAKGGINIPACLEKFKNHINHFHFKDFDAMGEWSGMGKGFLDFKGMVRQLEQQGYCGWIMVEEESQAAVLDPDAVTRENGKYIESFMR